MWAIPWRLLSATRHRVDPVGSGPDAPGARGHHRLRRHLRIHQALRAAGPSREVIAEELTATIDTCFVTLPDLAVTNDGRLLKFGGDALLVYFSGDSHEARACLAAIEMRRAQPPEADTFL
jgi:class 3 adenylate cyclase